MGNDVGNGLRRSPSSDSRTHSQQDNKPQTLGILAFETAKTMSRLLSIHKSLTESEIIKLRKEIVRSEGIAYLISKDEEFLLKLAYTEKNEDVDRVAMAVGRLGKRCRDPILSQFGRLYDELKLGSIDIGKFIVTKDTEKIIEKLEKFIFTTAELHLGLETLAEMETSERKMKQWKINTNVNGAIQTQKANLDLFYQKLTWQKQRVRHLRQISLWDQTFDKTVGLMARVVCIVYTRINVVFASNHVPVGLSKPMRLYADSCQVDLTRPRGKPAQRHRSSGSDGDQFYPDSCPIDFSKPRGKPVRSGKPAAKFPMVKRPASWAGESEYTNSKHTTIGIGIKGRNDQKHVSNSTLLHATSASTVGGAGLALRYANVVIIVERHLMTECASIDKHGREDLYQMLPVSLRRLVGLKWREAMRRNEEEGKIGAGGGDDDKLLVECRKEEVKGILRWLGPLARDTVRWHMERNVENQSFEVKPTVLLLQTLFFADKEKSEAAIAELLVGLSCIYKYRQVRRWREK